MKLSELINKDNILDISGKFDLEVNKIAYDSRQAEEGSVFVAIKGFVVDGHDFIKQVIKRGVKVIIVEEDIDIED